jgi:hypothetical protein
LRLARKRKPLFTQLPGTGFLGNSNPGRRHEKRAREISPALVFMCAKDYSVRVGLAIGTLKPTRDFVPGILSSAPNIVYDIAHAFGNGTYDLASSLHEHTSRVTGKA